MRTGREAHQLDGNLSTMAAFNESISGRIRRVTLRFLAFVCD
jgi:hypothetical protein